MDKQAQLKALREKRAAARKDSEAILDEAHAMVGGVEANLRGALLGRYTASDEEVAAIGETIEALQRALDMERADAVVVEEDAEARGISIEEATVTDSDAFEKYLRVGATGMKPEEMLQLRTQTAGTGSEGGFLTNAKFLNRVIEQLEAFGGVAANVTTINTATGSNLSWPTLDDTANEGELLGEEGPVTGLDLVFGQASLDAYVYSSKEIPVSWVLLQDDEVDIVSIVASAIATRLGRITNRHYTVGTGSAQPDGIVTGSTLGRTAETAGGLLFTYADLLATAYSLDPAYMNNVKWMFNHNTAGVLRAVVDGDGNKAWQPSLKDGEPDRLLGHPTTNNQHMADVGTGNITVLFGDFASGYMIRNVKDLSVLRLDELYAKTLQSGFFGWMRSDATKINTSAYSHLIMAAA